MKLLNGIGDVLLAKLVPGIDAKANCGTCRYSGWRCNTKKCTIHPEELFTDLCGNLCYSRCKWNVLCV